MAPWKGHRRDSWASSPNIAVYIFIMLFTAWLFFQVWAEVANKPAPTDLTPLMAASLAAAVTSKTIENRNGRDERDSKQHNGDDGDAPAK